MERLHRTHRLTSILATHNLALARRCGPRFAFGARVASADEAAAHRANRPLCFRAISREKRAGDPCLNAIRKKPGA